MRLRLLPEIILLIFLSRGTGNLDPILSRVPYCITNSINQRLLAPYTEEEIVEALKGMNPTKASGQDSFPAIFYQRFWSIIGKDTSRFYLEVLNEGKSLEEINGTQVVLISKVSNPFNMKNFWPISLCTVIYKIIPKTVANHLQKVLNECINDSQYAFVPGRLITDNLLLAYEVLHYLKNKITGKMGYMALKLDMSKAYDRME